MKIVNIADLRDPDDPQGRTYRQVNAENQTPLYYLCYDKNDTEPERVGWLNRRWTGGYPEDSLIVVRLD